MLFFGNSPHTDLIVQIAYKILTESSMEFWSKRSALWECCCIVGMLLPWANVDALWVCCCIVGVLLHCGKVVALWECCCIVGMLLHHGNVVAF